MVSLGTALCPSATKVMLLGCGELGKEVALECQRLGIEVIAVDRYANAPAMQVAHRSYVIDMLNPTTLCAVIEKEQPNFVVPEIEAIATEVLLAVEQQGITVVPNARASMLTMDREGIRRLAAEKLNLSTSKYLFADNLQQLTEAVSAIGLPCIIKPVMSSSGKGQSLITSEQQLNTAWDYACHGARGNSSRVIVEQLVTFDYEITLLTISAYDGIHFCPPVGHIQENGDYRESWQPQLISELALQRAQCIACSIVSALGGYGLFGVELFVRGDEVIFSEVSPRPHDTGMVTLISQDLSQFSLHVRAFLGFPVGSIRFLGPAASAVLLPKMISQDLRFSCPLESLADGNQMHLFGKPDINGQRRLGVLLAYATDTDAARAKARKAAELITITG